MICYRDRSYCSEERCGNLECSRNQKTIDRADLERTGLGICTSTMRRDGCGFATDVGDKEPSDER